MLELMPSKIRSPFGFHAAANVSPRNQNQPATEMNPTGRITPHTVTEPMRPVIFGPPKLATVVNHSKPITPAHVSAGDDVKIGKNAAR